MSKDKFLEELPLGGRIKPGRPPTTPAEEHYRHLNSPEGEAEFRTMMHKAAEEYGGEEEREENDIGVEMRESDSAVESYRDKLAIALKTLRIFAREGKLEPNSPFHEIFETLHRRDRELRRMAASYLTRESRRSGILSFLGKAEEEATPELMEERHDVAHTISVLLKLWEEGSGELNRSLSLEELEKILETKVAEISRALESR